MGPFKAGILQLAIEAGVPVVPVAIEGAGRVLPPSGFSVRPGEIVLRFGDPIETTGMAPQDRNALARRAREGGGGVAAPRLARRSGSLQRQQGQRHRERAIGRGELQGDLAAQACSRHGR